MRTGADYKADLRDGRQVWVLGGHKIKDVTTDPLTAGVVDTYAQWFDRHNDPEWRDVLWTSGDDGSAPEPVVYRIPETADDLQRIGRAVRELAFDNAGNITHPPSYGAMITLGILDCVARMGQKPEFQERAAAYRDEVAAKQLFITMGAIPLTADRFRAPEDRHGMRVVSQDEEGIVVSGMIGLQTATPFVDEVFVIGGLGPSTPEQRVMFATPVGAPGVRVVARRTSSHHPDADVSPLSQRYDELDSQLWLDEVRVPWSRVFAMEYEMPFGGPEGREFDTIVAWMLWHQQLGWLARQEFSLGLCFLVAHSLGLTKIPGAMAKLVDAIIEVDTVRNAVWAAEHDPWASVHGYVRPNLRRLGPGAVRSMQHRDRMSELVRDLAGQAGMLTPTAADLDDPELAEGLEIAFGGGPHTAHQRAALLNFAADHAASALDARESSFEAHANGGTHTWRSHIRRWYDDYTPAANRVATLVGADLPDVDLDSLRDVTFGG